VAYDWLGDRGQWPLSIKKSIMPDGERRGSTAFDAMTRCGGMAVRLCFLELRLSKEATSHVSAGRLVPWARQVK
jgi:hypothetical protein